MSNENVFPNVSPSRRGRIEGEWHRGFSGARSDPNYASSYPDSVNSPPITSEGSYRTYTDFIALVGSLWAETHPDIPFQRYSSSDPFDATTGVMVYSRIDRITKDGNSKPAVRREHIDEEGIQLVFTQSFVNIVKFAFYHRDGAICDQVMEQFEDDMIVWVPAIRRAGIEDVVYQRGYSDEQETRDGIDIDVAAISYRVTTQNLLTIPETTLEEVFVRVETLDNATPSGTYFQLSN